MSWSACKSPPIDPAACREPHDLIAKLKAGAELLGTLIAVPSCCCCCCHRTAEPTDDLLNASISVQWDENKWYRGMVVGYDGLKHTGVLHVWS